MKIFHKVLHILAGAHTTELKRAIAAIPESAFQLGLFSAATDDSDWKISIGYWQSM